ncbi:MAG: hypothetical protein L0H74_00265 [Brachybacterium sp.]|nr:hypothetical protein [Brachybacterium sp.]
MDTAATRSTTPYLGDKQSGSELFAHPGSRFEARLFGPFKIQRTDGVDLDSMALGRTSVRTLLKWFLLHPGERFDASDLCKVLWPAAPTQTLGNRLDVTVHHLRRLLEPELPAPNMSNFVKFKRNGLYWFDDAGTWRSDLQDTQEDWSNAERAETRGDAVGAIELLEAVVDRHDATFLLENLFDDAFAPSRAAQEVVHRDALARLLDLYVAVGSPHQAVPCALTLLELDPYSERAATTLAEIQLGQGHRLSARTHLGRSLRQMQQELGCRPSEHALQVWREIADPA